MVATTLNIKEEEKTVIQGKIPTFADKFWLASPLRLRPGVSKQQTAHVALTPQMHVTAGQTGNQFQIHSQPGDFCNATFFVLLHFLVFTH